jgi:Fic family protein
MALGEIQSKIEHIASTPLKPVVAKKMHNIYLAKGAQATTAIEGNTLSEQEVRDEIEGKLKLPPSKEYLGKEISNVLAAYNTIGTNLLDGRSPDLSCAILNEFNRMVLEGLDVQDGVIPGVIRTHPVGVSGARYRGAPAEDCKYLIDRLCDWINNELESPNEAENIAFGIIRAIAAHVYIAWIHPFGDGNGRTARLVEFQILLAAGVTTPAAHLLSNYYNETRQVYYKRLDESSKSGGDVTSFIEYAIVGFLESLRSQLKLITEQVLTVTWENYIHDTFRNSTKAADRRRRQLTLDISRQFFQGNTVTLAGLRGVSTCMAEHYAGKTSLMVSRDTKELMAKGLISIAKDGSITPNISTILSFRPARRDSQ